MPIPGAQVVAPSGKKKGGKAKQQQQQPQTKQDTTEINNTTDEKTATTTTTTTTSNPKITNATDDTASSSSSSPKTQQQPQTKVLTRAQHPLAPGLSRILIRDELLELDPTIINSQLPDLTKLTPPVELPRSFLPNPYVIGTGQEKPNPLLQNGVPRGLINGSNACFVASVLQILISLPSFCTVCISAAAAYARQQVGENNGQVKKRRGGDTNEPTASILGRWMMQCWQPMPTPIPLPTLRVEEGRLRVPGQDGYKRQSQMAGEIQQDAHEFLQLLLSRIDDDCKNLGLVFGVDDFSKKALQEQIDQHAKAVKSAGGNGWVQVGKGKDKTKVVSKKNALQLQQKLEEGNDDNDDDQQQQKETTSSLGASSSNNKSDQVSSNNNNTNDNHLTPSHLIFGGDMHMQIRGGENDKTSSIAQIDEPFLMLMMNVASGKSVAECIASSLARQIVESADPKVPDMIKTSKIQRAPKYALLVHITRWAMTREGDILKLDNAIQIDKILNLKFSGSSPQTAGTAKFRLKSVLCHRGRLPSSGHYVTYLYNYKTASSKSGKTVWIDDEQLPDIVCANDTRVTKVDGSGEKQQATVEKDTPYLLCYVRE